MMSDDFFYLLELNYFGNENYVGHLKICHLVPSFRQTIETQRLAVGTYRKKKVY